MVIFSWNFVLKLNVTIKRIPLKYVKHTLSDLDATWPLTKEIKMHNLPLGYTVSVELWFSELLYSVVEFKINKHEDFTEYSTI